jgi:glycosyltransferase involved in cell wall biosynthesis
MLILGCPVINQKPFTKTLIESLVKTVANPDNFMLVIVDNNSTDKYTIAEFGKLPFKLEIIHNDENKGYYYPLLQLMKFVKNPEEDLVGLVHNDVMFYEQGFNTRMHQAFKDFNHIGCLGLVGSDEADSNGGRGGGTMCFFNGEHGQSQAAGLRVTGVEPAVILDSLFMLFRATVVPFLKIDDEITPCHFYDRIWSVRTIESGWSVAILGTEIDHMGGITSCAEADYQKAAMQWCDKHNLPYEVNRGDHYIYLESERRFLSEYRDQKHFIPMKVSKDWKYERR